MYRYTQTQLLCKCIDTVGPSAEVVAAAGELGERARLIREPSRNTLANLQTDRIPWPRILALVWRPEGDLTPHPPFLYLTKLPLLPPSAPLPFLFFFFRRDPSGIDLKLRKFSLPSFLFLPWPSLLGVSELYPHVAPRSAWVTREEGKRGTRSGGVDTRGRLGNRTKNVTSCTDRPLSSSSKSQFSIPPFLMYIFAKRRYLFFL